MTATPRLVAARTEVAQVHWTVGTSWNEPGQGGRRKEEGNISFPHPSSLIPPPSFNRCEAEEGRVASQQQRLAEHGE